MQHCLRHPSLIRGYFPWLVCRFRQSTAASVQIRHAMSSFLKHQARQCSTVQNQQQHFHQLTEIHCRSSRAKPGQSSDSSLQTLSSPRKSFQFPWRFTAELFPRDSSCFLTFYIDPITSTFEVKTATFRAQHLKNRAGVSINVSSKRASVRLWGEQVPCFREV